MSRHIYIYILRTNVVDNWVKPRERRGVGKNPHDTEIYSSLGRLDCIKLIIYIAI